MKHRFIKSSILAGLASLLFAFSSIRVGALTDITKPYLGEYECKSVTYGSKEYIDDFSYIILELNPDNTFVLRYENKKGKKGEERGKYAYDNETNTLRFQLKGKGALKRDFPLEKGGLQIVLKLGWKTLVLTLEQK